MGGCAAPMNAEFYARVMLARYVSSSTPCVICGALPSALMVVAWNPGEDGDQVRQLDVCRAFCADHVREGEQLGNQLRARPNGRLEVIGPAAPEGQ
jgi:hypothetical protein